MNGRPRNAYASASVANVRSSAAVAGQRLAVLADPQEALLGQAPALVAGHRPRSRTLCSFEPVKWIRYVPASPGGMTIRSTCGPRSRRTGGLVAALVDDVIDHPERRERAR